MQNLRKSIFGAILGLALAVGFGIGATQLHASITADEAKTCDTAEVCPVKAADACPTDAKETASKDADACPMSKGSSI